MEYSHVYDEVMYYIMSYNDNISDIFVYYDESMNIISYNDNISNIFIHYD
jgi:hypothetical protein